MISLWKAFTRRKPIEKTKKSRLRRCLGTTDLTALGIGSTLGVGVYVIIGTVAYNKAGPSVVLSFVIAAVSSIFAGLCYAEFGALVPKAGSAYIYSYICVGELMAFIIGWNLVLEYVIGTASVARSYSTYLDGLFDNKIQGFLSHYLRLPDSKWFSSYPDLFAFALVMVLAMILAVGVKESTQFTKIFTGINFFVIVYVVIVGSFKIDFHNWNIRPEEIPGDVKAGKGGFFPYGIEGTVKGAATCFYSFVGFDAIATTGEEVLNPQRSLPISIILSLTLVTLAYCSVSALQTLMWPYWDQSSNAALPYVFGRVGYPLAKHVITVGALAGLSTSLLGGMFPLPRIIYAMGNDRLLFRFLAKLHPRFKTPLIATILSGLLTGAMATFFNIDQLADMMSIGTLLAYSLVAVSVLILRYKKREVPESVVAAWPAAEEQPSPPPSPNPMSGTQESLYQGSFWSRFLNLNSSKTPDNFSSRSSLILIALIFITIFIFNVIIYLFEQELYTWTLPTYAMVMLAISLAITLVLLAVLARQPMAESPASFQVPFVPVIPFLSIFANTYLMVHLDVMTWYRFIGWMIIGFIIYFSYGIVKSVGYLTEAERNRLSLNNDEFEDGDNQQE